MTVGALIFAFNNEQTDYVAMAAWSAQNIQRHLNIPVAVVTDSTDSRLSDWFDKVITAPSQTGGTRYFEDYAQTVTWHNAARINAYALTPWDQTLVLDADYVVASSELRTVLAGPGDFMCHRKAYDVTTTRYLTELNQFGTHNLPMWWATVMMFRKSNTAQYIFDCMQMIHDNWPHYRALYGINQANYRNDFALSIALGIVSGHTGSTVDIPWPLASVLPAAKLSSNAIDSYLLEYNNSDNQSRYTSISGYDFHAMGKKHLGDIVAATC